MRSKTIILLLILLLPLVGGCKRLRMPNQEPPQLQIHLWIPAGSCITNTRAELGAVQATSAEKAINSLRVWVFEHNATGTGNIVGYIELGSEELSRYNLQGGTQTNFSILVTEDIAKRKPNVDVYAIINAESTGWSIPSDATTLKARDLDGLAMSGDIFGVSALTSAVPPEGLPVAGVMKDVEMTGSFPVLSIATLTMTRAVSKLRFVFCALADGSSPVADFKITGITLSGQIGNNEKLFTTNIYADGSRMAGIFDVDGYVTLDKKFPADGELPQTLAPNSSPGVYSYVDGQDISEWENSIDFAVDEGRLTEWCRAYLRETDKPLTVKISYTIDDEAKGPVTFSLEDGDFTRNHSWTIYAYFIGGKLILKPTIVPWIAGHDYYNYQTQGQTVMESGISYLRYDVDGVDWTWFTDAGDPDTWMCISYSPHGARPLYSTLNPISLHTNNEYTLVLQSNNPHFLLQEVEYTGNTVTGYKTPVTSITLAPGENDTAFYIVAAAATLGGRSAYGKIFLTATPDPATGVPPYNVPFNHLLPGPEGHTAILLYDPLPPTYMDNMDNTYVESDDPAARVHYWWVGDK